MLHELNQRTNEMGTAIALLWDDETDTCYIEMENREDWERFAVPNLFASDAFTHPYVYKPASEKVTRHPDFIHIPTAGTYGDE